jgi:hypothetical protein
MDMRTVPPVINSAPNASVTGAAPQLGAMVPGTTGGMPAVGGLSVTQNPMAKQLQSYGRGDDKMLVHMTPGEVNGLQQLAMAHGGSLTINPHTGLPEAGWLGKLLPTLIGFGLAATGVGAPLAAGMVAAGQTALTGDLSKGLMAGLGAFGGAGLAGAVGAGGTLLGGNAGGLLGESAGMFGANMGAGAAVAPTVTSGVTATAPSIGATAPSAATTGGIQTVTGAVADPALSINALSPISSATAPTSGGLLSKFGQSVTQGLPAGTPGMITKAAPMAAGAGLLGSVSDAMQPKMPTYNEEDEYKSNYNGPYVPGKRELSFQSPEQMRASGGAEHKYFTPSNPPPRSVNELTPEERAEYGFAEGGLASLPAANDFQSAVNYFSANSPGAITASMRPDYAGLPPSGAGEIMSFKRPSANLIPNPIAGGGGGGNAIGGFGGYDEAFLTGLYDRFGRMEDSIINPDYSALDDRFGRLENRFGEQLGQIDSGIDDRFNQYDSRFNIMQDSITPALTGINDRFGQLENNFTDQFNQLDSGLNNRLGQVETNFADQFNSMDSGLNDRLSQIDSRFNTLPTTDLSGVYDRFGQLENRFGEQIGQLDSELDSQLGQINSRFDSIPSTDLSGVYSQLGNLDSRLSNMPATDLSGVYDQLGQINSRFESIPSTDLSGVYDQLGSLDSRLSNMPAPAATDLSGVYDRLGQIDSRFNSLPTPAATDLSGVYDRLGQIDSRFNSLPSPAATDLSGVYDRLGQIDSRFDAIPTPASTDLSGVYAQLQQLQDQLAASQQAPTDVPSGMQSYDNFGEFARGGEVDMRNGSFVVDARTVSELGNGSSNAGMELLARMGGRPLQGPGDGVSDSIRARIGGKQEARVARDEVLFTPEAVKRIGGGSDKRGTAKLYSLMDKAHKARKKAKRGEDTKVRKGLA